MLILVILGLIPWGGDGVGGIGEEVLIGKLPSEELSRDFDDQLDQEQEIASQSEEMLDAPLDEVLPPGAVTSEDSLQNIEVNISPSGSSDVFNSESTRLSASATGGEDFDGLIQRLRRDGLDICIVFDSTGSMSGEINEVKSQIDRIGSALVRLVPKTRISIVTYRDSSEEFRELYEVKGMPLTNDIQLVDDYLSDISAGGGGDHPEAVHAGLQWATDNNRFRSRARKVILLFGDAPPHQNRRSLCLKLAGDFRNDGGVVSTVTCRHRERLPEFVEIAQMGGGEAFLTSNEREIMTQLIVLVFGSQHRRKVLEAFELLGG
jgi:Mg-chelatase subunit ChlD